MTITSLVPFLRCVCGPTEIAAAEAEGYKEIYIQTSKGIFKRHIIRGGRYVQLPVQSIPGLPPEPEIKPVLNFFPAGKVPYALYEQIEAFFRRVIQLRGAALEAMIFVLHNKDRGYYLWVPDQTVGAASVAFDPSSIPADSDVIINVHSHGHMNSFFSGTDNENDKTLLQFSGVLGNFNTPKVTSVWRFNYFDFKVEYKLEDLFEAPAKPETVVPEEWLEKVKVTTPAVYHYPGNGGYSGRGNVVGGPGAASGRNLDHLKKWQFPKGTNTPPNPNAVNGNKARPLVQSTDPDDYLLEGQNFNDFYNGGDHSSVGGATSHPQRLPGFNPPEIPGRVWRYDPKAGVDVSQAKGMKDDDGDPVGGNESSLSVVVEDPTFSHEEADQTHLGKSLSTMREFAALLQTGKHMSESQHCSLSLLCIALRDVAMSATDLATFSLLSQYLRNYQEQNPLNLNSCQEDAVHSTVISNSVSSNENFVELGRYEEVRERFGAEVADAWWDMDQAVSVLNGCDELAGELMGEMFQMITTENQLKHFRRLHDSLSPDDKEKLMLSGF